MEQFSKSELETLGKTEKDLNNVAMQFIYKSIYLPIKANPVQFLQTRANIDGQETNFENICDVEQAGDYAFNLYPTDKAYTPDVVRSLKMSQPFFNLKDETEGEDGMVKIRCEMPEIDDDRKDQFDGIVKALHGEATAKINLKYIQAQSAMGIMPIDAALETGSVAASELKLMYDQAMQKCNDQKDKLLADIEKRNQMYHEEQNAKNAQKTSDNSSNSMKV